MLGLEVEELELVSGAKLGTGQLFQQERHPVQRESSETEGVDIVLSGEVGTHDDVIPQ